MGSLPKSESAILEFEEVVTNSSIGKSPMSFALATGEMAFIPLERITMAALGIEPLVKGRVLFEGNEWSDLSAFSLEQSRRSVGFVINPEEETSRIWMANLSIKGNIKLAPRFDPNQTEKDLAQRVETLAETFELDSGILDARPATITPADSIRAQWVRAFVAPELQLLIVENPLQDALAHHHETFCRSLRHAMETGTAVLWVSEEKPEFAKLGLNPIFPCP